MDYVPAHGNTAKRDDREDISGARAFDGEDQGKLQSILVHSEKGQGLSHSIYQWII